MIDVKGFKTGDLIDEIHDIVCGLGADGTEVPEDELQYLFSLVDELRRRSLKAAIRVERPLLNS